MAKVERPLFSDEATGRVGQAISFRNEETWPKAVGQHHRSPSTSAALLANRAAFKSACASWRLLSQGEKDAYTAAAPGTMTGFQYFLQQTL